MIITRTPLRVSFFGGGTDYPAYYRRNGGATLATAIDKYVYVTVQALTEFFDHTIQVHYSRVESVTSPDTIEIPIVRETLRLLGIERGVEIHLVGDLPARTGLGTSSATTVGLLKALHGYRGDLICNEATARQAVKVEQEMIGDPVGCQDQYMAALGGFQHLEFMRDGKIHAEPVPMRSERRGALRDRLMLFYTGLQRDAKEIVGEQVRSTQDGQLDRCLEQMRRQVESAVEILTGDGPLRCFGELLNRAWELKRGLTGRVSNPWLDEVYRRARTAGALGGKLLGAGGGGFMLLYAEPERQPAVRDALHDLREVNFAFEPAGTQIIYYVP